VQAEVWPALVVTRSPRALHIIIEGARLVTVVASVVVAACRVSASEPERARTHGTQPQPASALGGGDIESVERPGRQAATSDTGGVADVAQVEEEEEDEEDGEAARAKRQRAISAAFAAVLPLGGAEADAKGAPPPLRVISADGDFWELGGDSLRAALCIQELRGARSDGGGGGGGRAAAHLEVHHLYRYRTVGRLSEIPPPRPSSSSCSASSSSSSSSSSSTQQQEAEATGEGSRAPGSGAAGALGAAPLRRSGGRSVGFTACQVFWLCTWHAFDLAGLLGVSQFFVLRGVLTTGQLCLLVLVEIVVAPLLVVGQLVLLKWLTVGRYRPGHHTLFGMFHFMHWCFQNYFYMTWILLQYAVGSGTQCSVLLFRALGARVGRNVHIDLLHHASAFDLLTLECGATLNTRASLHGVRFSHRGILVGAVTVGCRATLGQRTVMNPNTQLGAGSVLWDMSVLRANSRISDAEVWSGIPAARCSVDAPLTRFLSSFLGHRESAENGQMAVDLSTSDNLSRSRRCCGGVWGVTVALLLCELVSMILVIWPLLIVWCGPKWEALFGAHIDWDQLWSGECQISAKLEPVYYISWLLPSSAIGVGWGLFVNMALVALTPRVRPGVYSHDSWAAFHIRFRLHVFNRPWNALICNTLFANAVYKMAGCTISADCRRAKPGWWVGLAEMVTWSDKVFTGDGAVVGYPQLLGGRVYVGRVMMAERTFVGNFACIPPGSYVPPGTTIGVNSIAPRFESMRDVALMQPAGTVYGDRVWMGSPPIGVPNTQATTEADWQWPRLHVYLYKWISDCLQLFCELILLVSMVITVAVLVFQISWASKSTDEDAQDDVYGHGNISWAAQLTTVMPLVAPLLGYFLALSSIASFVYLNSILFIPEISPLCCTGRAPADRSVPYWSFFTPRWEYVTALRKLFEGMYYPWAGTAVYNQWQRFQGAQIGKNVVCVGVLGILDPEYTHLDDGSVVEFEASMRTHTHERFKLRLGHVRVGGDAVASELFVRSEGEMGSGCTMETGSSVMIGARLAPGATLRAESCLTKGMQTFALGMYESCPAQLMNKSQLLSARNDNAASTVKFKTVPPDHTTDVVTTRRGQCCQRNAAYGATSRIEAAAKAERSPECHRREQQVAIEEGPTLLHHIFERTAMAYPERPAIETDMAAGGGTVSYRRLNELADECALALQRVLIDLQPHEPLSRDTVVGIYCVRGGIEPYVAMLAISKAGFGFLALDPILTASELLHMVLDSAPAAILTSGAELQALEAQFKSIRTAAGTTDSDTTCPLPALVDVARLLAVADGNETTATQQQVPVPADVGPGDLCYLMYTSGSSGKPKACVIEHASIVNLALQESLLWPIEPSDRVLQAGSFSFDMALEELMFAWFSGAVLLSCRADVVRSGPAFGEWLIAKRPTVVITVPTVLSSIGAGWSERLRSIRLMMVTGEPCPSPLVCEWSTPARPLWNLYGPTEATCSCTYGSLVPGQPVDIGKAIPTYSCEIVDPDTLQPVAEQHADDGSSVAGELIVCGPGVGRGYLNRPEKTAAQFVRAASPPLYPAFVTSAAMIWTGIAYVTPTCLFLPKTSGAKRCGRCGCQMGGAPTGPATAPGSPGAAPSS
jgi:non-ribosomal peptide synthetase-like protein